MHTSHSFLTVLDYLMFFFCCYMQPFISILQDEKKKEPILETEFQNSAQTQTLRYYCLCFNISTTSKQAVPN